MLVSFCFHIVTIPINPDIVNLLLKVFWDRIFLWNTMPIERQIKCIKGGELFVQQIVGLCVQIYFFEVIGGKVNRGECIEMLPIPTEHVFIAFRRITCFTSKNNVFHFVRTTFNPRKDMVNRCLFRRMEYFSAICTSMVALLQFLNLLFV